MRLPIRMGRPWFLHAGQCTSGTPENRAMQKMGAVGVDEAGG